MEFIVNTLKLLGVILLGFVILTITLLLTIIGYTVWIFSIIFIILLVLKFIGWIFGIPLLLHIFTTLRNIKL